VTTYVTLVYRTITCVDSLLETLWDWQSYKLLALRLVKVVVRQAVAMVLDTRREVALSGSLLHLGLLLLARRSRTTTETGFLLLELLASSLEGPAEATTQGGLGSLSQPLLDDSDLATVTARLAAARYEAERLWALVELQEAEREIQSFQARLRGGTLMVQREDVIPPSHVGSSDDYSYDENDRQGRTWRASKRPKRHRPTTPSNPSIDEEVDEDVTPKEKLRGHNDSALRAEAAIKVADPSRYKGKTIIEHTKFFWQCETVFQLKPVIYKGHAKKVTWSASYFNWRLAGQ